MDKTAKHSIFYFWVYKFFFVLLNISLFKLSPYCTYKLKMHTVLKIIKSVVLDMGVTSKDHPP